MKTISFFLPSPIDAEAITIDTKTLDAVTEADAEWFSEEELAFWRWYKKAKSQGLLSSTVVGTKELLDLSQHEICRNILKLLNAPTKEDPDLL